MGTLTGRRWRLVCLSLSLLTIVSVATRDAGAADAIPGEQWCERTVDAIRFTGNKVTREQVIRRELFQQEGVACSLDAIIDGIQNLLDLGLFKSVQAQLELNGDELTLYYHVVEKIFFLPIPRFSRTSDGELRLGAQLRWDNFQGRLHQVKLTSEKRQENDGQGRAGYIHSIDYTVPRFFGSRYGMRLRSTFERRNAQLAQDGIVYGETLRQSRRGGFRLARWASDTSGISGLSYFAGFGIELRSYDMRSGTAGPFSDGQDIALVGGFDVTRVHQDPYRRRGHQYGATLILADTSLGSDFSYARADVQARWYLPLARALTNLNVQARLGVSDRAPFGERSYRIGGGELLRGMESDAHTGNILTLLNVEYLAGFFAYPAWRWLVFADMGNVYLGNDVNLLEQHLRGGIGLRWKLEALTNTDLRLDLAWDPDKGDVKPYVSTSLTF
ncbi:MAG: BamA/TamA family outer membrane protein [Granulosicoccus sp.]|nr:BamA/TamA family outer membrane protein [Granulosicoccus sp.]